VMLTNLCGGTAWEYHVARNPKTGQTEAAPKAPSAAQTGRAEDSLEQHMLIATKLHPPAVREQTIPRPRLAERLNKGSSRKLTLVACPAGYGKTTLLADWRASEAVRKPIAWLTLDEGDRDPTVLWSYVIEALCRVLPELRQTIPPEITSTAPIGEVALPRLINELDAQGEVALILDDFHRLSSGPACETVAWFIEHAPSTVQLVIATRTEPALRLPALRVQGELLELRGDDLRFAHADAREFLNDRLKLGITLEDVDALTARTGGWPAGLYLAALSLRNAAETDRSARIARFGASNRHVIDYLVTEVLEAHDPRLQSLMMRTSILERLSGPLCDAVMETQGSAVMLDALSRSNLFLVRLVDESDWYRFHHLFVQLLRVELGRRDADLIPTLHRRAYEWHREHGSIEEAIHHAMAAGVFAAAADLVAAAWVPLGNSGKYLTILRWLREFPDEIMLGDPRLRAIEAWALALCGRPAEAGAAITAIEKSNQLSAEPLTDGFPSVEASLTTLQAIFLEPAKGDVGAQLALARRAAELVSPGTVWRSAVCWAVGWGLYFQGRYSEADRWFEESVVEGSATEQWIAAGGSLAYRSLIAGLLGRQATQHRLADQAERLVRKHRLEDVDGEAPLALAASLMARNRPTDALPLAERAVDCLRRLGQRPGLVDALLLQASVLRALGEDARASSDLAEVRSIINGCKDAGILGDRLGAFGHSPAVGSPRRGGELTERELTVLNFLCGELSEREIGRDLYLSHNTVHSHTRSIFRKLAVSSRADAVARAHKLGLVQGADFT